MKQSVKKIRLSSSDMIFNCFNYFFLGVLLVLTLYPLYFVVIASFSEPVAVQSGMVIFMPRGVTFEGYQKIFGYKTIWIGYRNTVFYVTAAILVSVTATMLTAYPLSRKVFLGKRFVLVFLMVTMYFSGGMIPLYIQIKSLKLLNTPWVLIIINAISVFNVIITRTFLQTTIPEELFEAAAIDGCNHFQYFARIVIPLSKSIMAVLALYYGIAVWNDYFNGMLYLTDSNLFPLQLILKNILTANEVSAEMLTGSTFEDEEQRRRLVDLMRYGLIIVSSVPVLILYPFLQRYFVKGVMIGSVKG